MELINMELITTGVKIISLLLCARIIAEYLLKDFNENIITHKEMLEETKEDINLIQIPYNRGKSMKYYFKFEDAGKEIVIECKNLFIAMKVRKAYWNGIKEKTKIYSKTAFKEYLEKQGLKLIKINEER